MLHQVQHTEDDEQPKDSWHSWVGSDWRRQETWTQNRRDEKLREGVVVLPAREGEFGAVHHWRRGLAGCVQDWARGSIAVAVTINDASGLTFVEWDPTKDADPSKPAPPPVSMIINSSELRGVGFKLTEVLPPELEGAARRRTRTRTRGAGVARLEGVAPSQYVLKSSDDNDLRALCE